LFLGTKFFELGWQMLECMAAAILNSMKPVISDTQNACPNDKGF
jgi:hypothetical protein